MKAILIAIIALTIIVVVMINDMPDRITDLIKSAKDAEVQLRHYNKALEEVNTSYIKASENMKELNIKINRLYE